MLKIKNNVNLKELEKFGFKYYSDINSSYYGCCHKQDKYTSIFINNAYMISISSEKVIFELDVLYDLIKADIVEKSDGNE